MQILQLYRVDKSVDEVYFLQEALNIFSTLSHVNKATQISFKFLNINTFIRLWK
jgi:hypothetical protein